MTNRRLWEASRSVDRLPSPLRIVATLLLACLLAGSAIGGMISQIVVFGDSLSDTGNVLAVTQFSQFSSTKYDVRPNKPWYDSGRWTNGTTNTGSDSTAPKTKPTAFGGVWHERLADKLKIPRAKNTLAGDANNMNNWAFGGATTGMGTFAQVLLNVGEQVKRYLAGNPTIKDSDLFAVWGGGNDVRDAARAGGATVDSIKAAAATAVANMKNSIASLAAKGAKLFLWPNLPPLDLTPEAMGMDVTLRKGLKEASELFRDQEVDAIAMLKKDTPGITINLLDVHSEFLKIVAKPGDFGLTEVAKGVVNVTDGKFSDQAFGVTANYPDTQVDADKFVFWDQIHPTAKTHELIADKALNLLMPVPEPSTLALIAAGLVIFVGCPGRAGMSIRAQFVSGMGRNARWLCGVSFAALSIATVSEVHATTLKTDAGNGVTHWHWMVNIGIDEKTNKAYDGYIEHDREGDETKRARTPERTAEAKKTINAYYQRRFPGLVVKGDPTVTFDCHSFTFIGGEPFLPATDVAQILVDNGWKQIKSTDKRAVGDIVIYKANGGITHSAVVTEINARGGVAKLQSKWGSDGTYEHTLTQVPAVYGAAVAEYRGGTKLRLPMAGAGGVDMVDDGSVGDPYHGISSPPMKDYLWDFDVNPEAGLFSEVPICPTINTGSHVVGVGVTSWDYGLQAPELTPVHVDAGDQLTLHGAGLVGAFVNGLAAQPEFGGWVPQLFSPQQAVFTATQTTSILDSSVLIDGFSITSNAPFGGKMIYTESVAGHIGFVAGPVPEPATVVLLLLGTAALFSWKRLGLG